MELLKCKVKDLLNNLHISKDLYDKALTLGITPTNAEKASWEMSIPALLQVLDEAKLHHCGVLLEYQIPYTSERTDFILTGVDTSGKQSVLIIELKQWSEVTESKIYQCVKVSYLEQPQLHPSVQVGSYRLKLQREHTILSKDEYNVRSCSYLHNLDDDSALKHEKFTAANEFSPLFHKQNRQQFITYLRENLAGTSLDNSLIELISNGDMLIPYNGIKDLQQVVSGDHRYILLGNQLIAYNAIKSSLRTSKNKKVVLVRGKPGTGKTAIALNLLGFASQKESIKNDFIYCTPSKSLSTVLQGLINKSIFKSVYPVVNSLTRGEKIKPLVICDEAHRLPETDSQGNILIDELIKKSQTLVLLLDENQIIRPSEKGRENFIKERIGFLNKQGYKVELETYDLFGQYRCGGNEQYINYLDAVFSSQEEEKYIVTGFEFSIFDTPKEMEEKLQEKMYAKKSARIVSGFCWKWNDPINNFLPKDVKIGVWEKPWNRKPPEMVFKKGKRGRKPAPEIHPYTKWHEDNRLFDEIGCIYSVQGFEFDYIGVIFGQDLYWDPHKREWRINLNNNKDVAFIEGIKTERLTDEEVFILLRNIYRILLSRGKYGCYVYFQDQATRERFESMIKKVES